MTIEEASYQGMLYNWNF